jgi:hypothetical protein
MMLLLACAACAHGANGGAANHGVTSEGATVTLYRDVALIQQRIEVDVPASGSATAVTVLGADVRLVDVHAMDHGALVIAAIREANAPRSAEPALPADAGADAWRQVYDEDGVATLDEPPPQQPENSGDQATTHPTAVAIDVTAEHAGHYAFTLAYTTPALTWQAAYTMTTTPAHAVVDARGSIVIENAAGIAFPRAHVTVIDDTVDQRRLVQVEDLVAAQAGIPPGDNALPPAHPHDLGRLDLVDGAVRAELYAAGARRTMRSALVYDPIGPTLDNPLPEPNKDETYGVATPASATVIESAEIVRDTARDLGLPSGPARLVERQPDGSLRVLAAGTMFDPTARAAAFDTMPVGIAHDVAGHRTRRELAIDEDRQRITEEFAIELDNQRALPLHVIVREHLYRSSSWSLGYYSVPYANDGAQEVSMRAVVPAHGKTQIRYVVVYWWDEHA